MSDGLGKALRGHLVRKRWAHCHGALNLDFSLDIGLSRARHRIVHQAQRRGRKANPREIYRLKTDRGVFNSKELEETF